ASVSTKPAPPTARLPKCTKCQSFAYPSALEYWHIGETNTRFANVISRIAMGSNSFAMGLYPASLKLRRSRNVSVFLSYLETSYDQLVRGASLRGPPLHN